MPPVFGPRVAVADALVVLGGRRAGRRARRRRAREARPPRPRGAPRSRPARPDAPKRPLDERGRDGGMRLGASSADDDALAGGEAVGLHDARRRRARAMAACAAATVSQARERGGRNARPLHELLGERLRALEPRAPRRDGPNTAMPASRSRSASPATSGASGPTTTRSTARCWASSVMPARSDTGTGVAARERGDAGVARRRVEPLEQRGAGQGPGRARARDRRIPPGALASRRVYLARAAPVRGRPGGRDTPAPAPAARPGTAPATTGNPTGSLGGGRCP